MLKHLVKSYALALIVFTLSLLPLTCSSPINATVNTNVIISRIDNLRKLKEQTEMRAKTRTKVNLSDLALRLAKRESRSNWKLTNSIGAIGKYQFMPSTLKMLGYNITTKDFINNPDIFPEVEQDYAMMRLLKINRAILHKYIDEFTGKYIHGYYITENGLLGAAHLAGAGNVIKFLETGYNPSDKYGTKLTDYLLGFK